MKTFSLALHPGKGVQLTWRVMKSSSASTASSASKLTLLQLFEMKNRPCLKLGTNLRLSSRARTGMKPSQLDLVGA